MCTQKDIGEFFVGKPDHLVLAFDRLLSEVLRWEPQSVGASVKSIVFTNHKAWLIVRIMTKEIDMKFYHSEKQDSHLLKKVGKPLSNKYAHHLRISHEEEVTSELLQLLKTGYDFALT